MRKTQDTRHESLERLLEAARELAKINGPASLAAALLESEQTVTNWGRRGVSKAGAMKAQDKFGCSSNWVLHGTPPRLIRGDESASISDLVEIPPPGAPAALSIPLLSWVRAGDFCESPGQFGMEDAEEFLPRPLFNTSKKTFALLVRGDSMDVSGGYREGEIVYIDPDVSPTPGRDVLAKTESGMTLKRYKEDEDGPYLLQLNGNKIIRPANWHVCGVVVFSGQKR